MQDNIIIYTDGSSLGNPGPGGYGAVIIEGNNRTEISDGFRKTTNNRMEILAAIVAIKKVASKGKEITIFSDSRLLVDTVQKGWINNWAKNGWRKSNNDPVLNIDLIKELYELIKKNKVRFVWVEAHAGIEENERCDVLSKTAAQMPNLKIDAGYEGVKTQDNLFSAQTEKPVPTSQSPKAIPIDQLSESHDAKLFLVNVNQKKQIAVVTKSTNKIEHLFDIGDYQDFVNKLNKLKNA